jgi:hypothetical protein
VHKARLKHSGYMHYYWNSNRKMREEYHNTSSECVSSESNLAVSFPIPYSEDGSVPLERGSVVVEVLY